MNIVSRDVQPLQAVEVDRWGHVYIAEYPEHGSVERREDNPYAHQEGVVQQDLKVCGEDCVAAKGLHYSTESVQQGLVHLFITITTNFVVRWL
jgi:hypothetical protein